MKHPKHSRSVFLAGPIAGLAATALRFPGEAAQFTYKWACDWDSHHPVTVRMVQAAGRILQDSGGRLQLRVFPNFELGSSISMLEQTRSGAIEFDGLSSLTTEGGGAPVTGLMNLPFVFADHKDAVDAFASSFGKAMKVSLEKLGLHVFDSAWDGSFRQLTNNVRPIRTPSDLRGLKMRVVPTPVVIETFKLFGAVPTPVDGSQMYVAAQTHLVDGTDLPLPSVDAFRMYEVQKYASVVNLSWTSYMQSANADAWRKLPADLQDIVERNMALAAQLERSDAVKRDVTVVAALRGRGMIINDADSTAFKSAIVSAGLYKKWRDNYGAEPFNLLERSVGRLT